ncbi:MAG: type II toxin-antitoxin system prevent-host-death family antitoxin [bacterium]|nr:type II toxin-antitoxin system prevent-host-death family antitoxin [bacterium]
MRLGLREANQGFSKAIRAVRAGKEVVLTDRGRPIAVISPLRAVGSGGVTLDRVVRAGFVEAAQREGRMPSARPVASRGKPLSRIVSEERDGRSIPDLRRPAALERRGSRTPGVVGVRNPAKRRTPV